MFDKTNTKSLVVTKSIKKLRKTLSYLFLFLFTYFLLAPFVPRLPVGQLDSSWKQVLVHAYVNGWQWGHDIIFTYGPYGFLDTGLFHPDLLLEYFCLWFFVSLFISLVLHNLFNKLLSPCSICIVICCILVLFPMHNILREPLYFLSCSLIYLYYPHVKGRYSKLLHIGLIISVALLSLIKTTVCIYALMNLLFADVKRVSEKKIPYLSMLYFVSYLAWYLIAKQKINALFDYWRGSLEIVSGYSEAMSVKGSVFELTLYLILCFLYVGIVGLRLLRQKNIRSVLTFLCLSSFLFICFKQGFVRHDIHSLAAWGGLFWAVLLYLPVVKTEAQNFEKMIVTTAIVTITCISFLFCHYTVSKTIWYSWHANRAENVCMALFNTKEWHCKWKQSFDFATKNLLQEFSMDSINKSVDSIDSIQSYLIASKLDYKPRPVIQEYSSFTSYLIKKNVQFYRSTPPDYIIFNPTAIDSRPPSMAEGASWPTILEQYRIIDYIGDRLLLIKKREGEVNAVTPSIVLEKTFQFGEKVRIPTDAGFIFAKMRFKKTFFGRFVSRIYKTEELYMDLYIQEKLSKSYRIIPGITREGYFIFPIIDDVNSFIKAFYNYENVSNTGNEIYFKIRIGNTEKSLSYVDRFSIKMSSYNYDSGNIFSERFNRELNFLYKPVE
jgi:hypothetical protein